MPRARTRVAALVLLVQLASAGLASAQNTDALPRRGSLGAALATSGGAVRIIAVIPNSAAASAGLRPGDVVSAIDGTGVASSEAAIAALRLPSGTNVKLSILRDGTSLAVSVTLLPAPTERDPLVKTTYASVTVDGTLRRVLLTTPANGKGPFPAILMIGGIGCYSIDNVNPQDAYRNLAHDLSNLGFLTLRLEKSGLGDSQGPPCRTVDFDAEMRSYEIALAWLTANPLADRSHLFIFGNSIGGVIAPRIAASGHVAGIVAADTVGINWFEYELINQRRQLELAGVDPGGVDSSMKTFARCVSLLELDGLEYADIIKAHQECATPLRIYPVPASYMREVAALDIAQPWVDTNVPVLVIYGTSDFITDESDHRKIVSMVNGKHAGEAVLSVITGMDHYLTAVNTQQESLNNAIHRTYGPYDHQLSAVVGQWLCRLARCKPSPTAAGASSLRR